MELDILKIQPTPTRSDRVGESSRKKRLHSLEDLNHLIPAKFEIYYDSIFRFLKDSGSEYFLRQVYLKWYSLLLTIKLLPTSSSSNMQYFQSAL